MNSSKSIAISLISKQYENKYLENTVKFGKPKYWQHTKQNLGLKGLMPL